MDMLSTTNERKNDDVGRRRAQTVGCQVGARGAENTQWETQQGNLLSTLAKRSPPKCSSLSHKLGSAEERGHESPLMRW